MNAVNESCLTLIILAKVLPESKIDIFIIPKHDIFSTEIKNKAMFLFEYVTNSFFKMLHIPYTDGSNCALHQQQNYDQVTKLCSPDA